MTERPTMTPDFEAARALTAPLKARLEHFAAALRERRPEVAEAYQSLIETLRSGEAGAAAPKDGDALPAFLLPDETGRLVASAELLSEGPLVISFNRGNWCSFCQLELVALAESHPEVRRRGGEIVSITPETATYGRRLKARLGLPFPVLSDIDNGYALELGLAIALSPEVRTLYRDASVDLGLYQRNDAWFVPIPATFLVDREGIIRESYVNADFRVRRDPAGLSDKLSELS